MRRRRIVLTAVGALVLFTIAYAFAGRPSNDRDWEPNEAVLAGAEFGGDSVTVRHVRNTTYRTPDDYTPAYYDATFDLRELRRVWFGVVPFSGSSAMAHTFLSFEFAGPRFITISVEARKERGEGYAPLLGLLRRYELMYVVADERDAIGLRAALRHDAVFLYPIRTAPERARQLFVGMLERANDLRERPQFYNTLTSNCTSTIVRHVNTLVPGRVPFSYRWLLPGFADGLAYDLGLIDTDLPEDSLRARFRISGAEQLLADSAAFSTGIRRGLPGQ